MARVNAPLLAFNRGECSKLALARVDQDRLRLAAECQLNWEPKTLGSMALRAGLEKKGETRGDARAKLLPFVFAKNDTAQIELTDGKMRVRVGDALVTRPAVSTMIADSTLIGTGAWVTSDTTSGCTTTIATGVMTLTATARGGIARAKQTIPVTLADFGKEHGLRLVVSNGPVMVRVGSTDGLSDVMAQTTIDTGEHALAFSPSSANVFLQIESTDARAKTLTSIAIDAAGTLELGAPWAEADLSSLRISDSGDIIFVASYGRQQYKLERRGTNAWSVVKYRSDNGPFQTAPSLLANLTPTVYEGNGNLASDRPFFTQQHVGTLFRLFCKGQANRAVLGAQNAFSDPVRVTGVGTVARDYTWTVAGTFSGTVRLQRSFDGPNSGYNDVDDVTAAGPLASATGGSAGTPPLDNVIAWERVGFKAAEYTSGSAIVSSDYTAGGGYGICRVTGWISPILVQIEVLHPFPSIAATDSWLEGSWSDAAGWPTCVVFAESRLWWFGRDGIWGSQTDNYTGYGQIDLDTAESLGDAGAIVQRFGDGPVGSVNWALALSRLLVGREMSVASIRSSAQDEPLTPTNFASKDCSTQGTARLPALKIDKGGIMVQESGARVYALDWSPSDFDYAARDLTRLNHDIGLPGITSLAVARQPDTMAYFTRTEGQVAALLYDLPDEVEAWWRIGTLGIIEDVCVLPAPSGPDNLVDFVVRRTIDGVTKRFIERLAPRANCKGGVLNQLLDCHIVYQGVASATITAAHLPNTAVRIWADGEDLGTVTTDASGVATLPDAATATTIVAGLGGAIESYDGALTSTFTGLSAYEGLPAEVFADQQPSDRMVRVGTLTVSGGAITLPNGWESANIVAMFGFVAPFMSAKLAYAAQLGSPLTQKKKINHLGLVLYDTHAQGLKQGQRFDQLDDMPLCEANADVPDDTIWSHYDEPMVSVPGEWDTDARLCLLAQAPLPCRVGAVVVAIVTNEK